MKGLSGGSPPKTTAQHQRDGTYKKHRHGRRADMEQQADIGRAPTWLDKAEQAEFRKIVRYMPKGFLRLGDEHALGTLARWHVKLHGGWIPGANDLGPLRLLWGEFGMTPNSRWRMPGPPKGKESDPFDELQKRRKARERA